jgi:hypothetical protein
MIKQLFATAIAVGALSLSAEARLGESSTECETRYGTGRELALEAGAGLDKEATANWTAKAYSTHGLSIQIVFDDDVAVLIKYANEPALKITGSTPPSVDLTVSEIGHLRGVNLVENTSWSSHKDSAMSNVAPNMKMWRSSDKTRHAGYDRNQKVLFVCTAAFWDVVAGDIKARASGGGGAATRFMGL